MPSSECCFQTPLLTLQSMLEQADNEFTMEKVHKYYSERITSEEDWLKIPSLNSVAADKLKPHSVVKFRGMVQDMFDPEYFLGVFETVDNSTQAKALNVGMMRDNIKYADNQSMMTESARNVYMERQPLYCVPIPGESSWSKQKFSSQQRTYGSASDEKSDTIKKRSRDDTDDSAMMVDCNTEKTNAGTAYVKRVCDGSEQSPAEQCNADTKLDLNFPISDEKGTPCLVKMYHQPEKEDIKLNDVIEFVGVLDVDPAFAETGFRGESEELLWPNIETKEEKIAHCPPSSLVPRLHCIVHRKLSHTNPLLPTNLSPPLADCSAVSELEDVRSSLVQLLSHVLFGDDLAAEFVLMNLVSRVYGRINGLVLGKFALNLSNCVSSQAEISVAKELHTVIEAITTKSCLVEMSLGNLNKRLMSPSKDYTANRLKTGGLQLAAGTHVVLNENSLESGQLQETGLRNVGAFEQAILFQKVEYDFRFHKTEMDTDLAFVIISEGTSLLQSDCEIPIKKSSQMHTLTALSLLRTLPQMLLDKIRSYISYTRLLDYDLSEDMQNLLQNDLVELRKTCPNHVNADTFHLLLSMSRLLTISHGQSRLTTELWERTKSMFSEVMQRQTSNKTERNSNGNAMEL